MRKMTLLGLVAALILGFASLAGAAELKVKGDFEAHAAWWDNTNFKDADNTDGDGMSEDDFAVMQRLRVRFDFVQNENLKAVLHIEVGDQTWGSDRFGGTFQVGKGSGGAISADGVAVEVKNAYLDFNIPETLVNVKVGIQGFAFPGTVFGTAVHDNDSAGVLLSAPINDMISVVFAWTRAIDANVGGNGDGGNSLNDEADVLLLALPITPEGMKITPYAAMAIVGDGAVVNGRDSDNVLLLSGVTGLQSLGNTAFAVNTAATRTDLINTLEDSTIAWWAGLAFELEMFDPFVVAFDFAYGSWQADLENSVTFPGWDEISSSGWLVDLSVKYKGFSFGTPELFFAYASGNSEDAIEDGNFGVLPNINDGYIDGWAIPGSFYFGGTAFSDRYSPRTADMDNMIMGHWTLGLALRDFSFVEKLTHTLIVMYIQGTHDEDFVKDGIATGFIDNTAGGAIGAIMSSKDHAWEIDFNHEYQLYEQLTAILELGWIHASYDEDVWNSAGVNAAEDLSDAWRMTLGLKYKF